MEYFLNKENAPKYKDTSDKEVHNKRNFDNLQDFLALSTLFRTEDSVASSHFGRR